MLADVSNAPFDDVIHLRRERWVVAKSLAGGDDRVGEALTQLGLGIGGLGSQRRLGADPGRAEPVAQLGVVEQLALQLLTARAVLGRVLEALRELVDPVVQPGPELVVGIGIDGVEEAAESVEETVEDAMVDRGRDPPRRLLLEARPQGLAVL